MKTVYPTTEIPHLWAHAMQDSARNAQGSVSFNGPALYSYSTVIAYRVDAQTFVVDMGRFSNTTSHHQSRARRAIRGVGVNIVECEGLHGLDLHRERWEFRLATWLVQDAGEKITQAAAKKRASYVQAGLVRTADKRLLDAMLIAERAPCQRGMKALVRKVSALQDAVRADWAQQARAYQRVSKERPVATPEEIAEWRAGHGRIGRTAHPVLRLIGDVVETSWGARVPVDAARQLWSLIARVRGDEYRSARLTGALIKACYRVGNYPFNEVRSDGSLVIGCHNIPASEVDIIAARL